MLNRSLEKCFNSLPIAEHVYYKQKKLHILVSNQYQVGNLNFVKYVEQIHKSDTVLLKRHISLLPLHFCSKILDLQGSLDQTQNIISRNKTNIYPCDNQSRKLLISSWKTNFFEMYNTETNIGLRNGKLN